MKPKTMTDELPVTEVEKFYSRVNKKDCWEWTGAMTGGGYGAYYIAHNGRTELAHRLSFLFFNNEIFSGRQLDHLCRNRKCVNPEHLEQVTPKTNLLRGEGQCAKNARKEYCKNGHEFTEYNTRLRPSGGRSCRICNRIYSRRHRLCVSQKK